MITTIYDKITLLSIINESEQTLDSVRPRCSEIPIIAHDDIIWTGSMSSPSSLLTPHSTVTALHNHSFTHPFKTLVAETTWGATRSLGEETIHTWDICTFTGPASYTRTLWHADYRKWGLGCKSSTPWMKFCPMSYTSLYTETILTLELAWESAGFSRIQENNLSICALLTYKQELLRTNSASFWFATM